MYILQQNLQILWKERWRYLVSKSAELSFSTKSVAVHMSGAVLCKKNSGQISENAVEQLQVPRNQRELTFATISLKERCTDWFTWCNSTVMMTNMKRNNIQSWKRGALQKNYIVCVSLHLQIVPDLQSDFFLETCVQRLGLWKTFFPSLLGQQLMVPVLINPDLLLLQDGCSGRLFVTFTIPLTYTPQL